MVAKRSLANGERRGFGIGEASLVSTTVESNQSSDACVLDESYCDNQNIEQGGHLVSEPERGDHAAIGANVVSPDAIISSRRWVDRVADYVELTKPRILVMILLTVGVAMIAVERSAMNWLIFLNTMLGTAMVAASASACNQLVERRRDALMTRTANRPLAAGRLQPAEGLIWGTFLLVVGSLILWLGVNLPTAVLGLLTWALYVGIYTPLKTRSWLNTAVGTVPGALPVMMGWTAAGGSLYDSRGWLLFAVVLLWQFPHFMAIAWLYRKQYEAAGYQMLTNVDPTGKRAGNHGIYGAVALIPISVAVLAPESIATWIVALVGVAAAVVQLLSATRFRRSPTQESARKLLRGSLLYLPVMLVLVSIRAIL
jgi:protoheme IX farnesyltransferase